MPTLDASWMSGQGVSSRSSHSSAAGRMTSLANSCTQSLTSRTSSLGSRENGVCSALVMIIDPLSNIAVTNGSTIWRYHG